MPSADSVVNPPDAKALYRARSSKYCETPFECYQGLTLWRESTRKTLTETEEQGGRASAHMRILKQQ